MHILITGTAGFIASKVAELLLDEGHTVAGVDNLNDAYDVRLKEWRLARLQARPGFRFQRLDIADRRALRPCFQNSPPDAVINLAARAGVRPSVQDPWIYLEANVTGTLNLLELCREFDVKKLVLASTSSLYGASNALPFREDANTDRPLSPYAASKKAAEALCYTYHALYGLDVTVFRYFTVYGPAGRPDMSPFRFVQWICEGRPVTVYGDGRQSRDFTYVDDIARGTVAGLRHLDYQVINLGSDQPVVLMDLVRLVEELAGRQAILEFRPAHPADVPATWADIGRAEQLLGWRPHVPFREGVERLVDWYRDNRDWAREIDTNSR
ncbi:MAG: NAD-dependent epimerase/dehydratase family protein [Anaerolineaceae bacterium]|nr:NAD-dependent epimerase/dehydratase family protein [Anaerolineaceae bacterium]